MAVEVDTPQAGHTGDGASGGQRGIRFGHPRFLDALLADARIAAAYRRERHQFRSRLDGVVQALRLMLVTDAFVAQAAYRLKARLQARGIPVLPRIAHRVAIMTAQVSIADTVLMHPGVFIPHGQVVIEGMTQVHAGTTLSPWVTLGMIGGSAAGPTIGPNATIGTGAKVLGHVNVGANARVGANAVVLNDVPPNTTVVGMPARPISR